MIRFDADECRRPESATAREWLETNGLGGFASSTITGLNARRYHGLLTAATRPPVGRLVMLSKLEETLVIAGRRYELATNQYPGAIYPHGYLFQTGFRLDPFPVFTYEVEGIIIEKSVFMIQGENSTVIQYEVKVPDPGSRVPGLSFELRPLVACRDYHSLKHENDAVNRFVQIGEGAACVKPYADAPALYLAHEADEVEASGGVWYRNFEYEAERERGFDYTEDLFNPLVLKFELADRASCVVIASTAEREAGRGAEYKARELARRERLKESANSVDELTRALTCAADQFIVARGEQKTVIAGYHWFSDWGRDTMISLPGLTLATGRAEVARSILLEFSKYVDRGMLPNRFPDAGAEPEYNTVDATLWFFEAVRALVAHTHEAEFVRASLYETLVSIIDWHVRGTRYNIRADEDGLLASGAPGAQLTWMDAKVGEWVVTPRRGKPVEIQALWYNALRVMEELARTFGDASRSQSYGAMAERARASFNEKFWNEEAACLYDVIDGESRDASLRPNQIFAVSLEHTMLNSDRARLVVEAVERSLLTPYGLRSLAPDDPHYRGRYEGDALSRDGSYHQGTVWGWLMGPFITASLKASGENAGTSAKVAA
ncbi:MAG: glycogen debranching enzyme N-terminal domain-containing protein, partial [Acidobacteria bacterium]|nr:glycogen debranching enzyme N-terminal domain-containing protein [Acidobacteriota bacterium]